MSGQNLEEVKAKKYLGQAAQDYFVRKALNEKKNGQFLEIGSNDPIKINNSQLLEAKYGWKGIMVEQDPKQLPLYQQYRPNSFPIIQDATTIDQRAKLEFLRFPKKMDQLQIDLEVDQGTTLRALQNLQQTVLNDQTFGVVTFEHDIQRGNFFGTREKSRAIFDSLGYYRVQGDVSNDGCAFEDWQIHPDHVDLDWANRIARAEALDWGTIVKILDEVA